jgi:HEPN domain-containing protein
MTPQHEEALRALRLADRDIAVFERIKDVPEVHLSMVCFHAQQAVEKSLKAVLFEKHVDFRRTHDLAELAALLHRAGISPPCADAELLKLNPYGVTFRYDDQDIELLTRDEAARIVRAIRDWAATLVGTPAAS